MKTKNAIIAVALVGAATSFLACKKKSEPKIEGTDAQSKVSQILSKMWESTKVVDLKTGDGITEGFAIFRPQFTSRVSGYFDLRIYRPFGEAVYSKKGFFDLHGTDSLFLINTSRGDRNSSWGQVDDTAILILKKISDTIVVAKLDYAQRVEGPDSFFAKQPNSDAYREKYHRINMLTFK